MSVIGTPAEPSFAFPPEWNALVRLIAHAIISPLVERRGEQASRPVGMCNESMESSLGRSLNSPSAGAPARSSSSSRSNEPAPPKLPGSHRAERDAEDEPGMADDHAETWALVHAAQAGDGEAFGKLYDRYVTAVFRFIYYRVNDRALAEDFTSETFLRALRRISTINYQGRDIGAWFMTIARNIVFDHAKSARFRLEFSTGDVIEGPETEAGPELTVLTKLTNARLLTAVNELGEEQKECIVLRFMHGLSVAETAAVMGKNDGAVKALQHRAVKRLATILGDDLR